MKSILIIFAFGLFAINVNAQSCHPGSGCCAKGASAALTAAQAQGIEVRKDVATGDLGFYKKTSCAYSDHASYVEVKYDAATQSFIHKSNDLTADAVASPVSLNTRPAGCCDMSKAACAEKMAKGECTDHMAAKAAKTSLATN
jgi:hypothetical protein